MLLTFIELPIFTERLIQFLSDERYAGLQFRLMQHPDAGVVMPGCGGLRKLRVENPQQGKGKRGGYRLVYLHVPEALCIFMIAIYSKSLQDEYTQAEKREARQLTEYLRTSSIARYQRWLEG